MTSIPLAATFYRGGTSKAVCFVASALPSDRTTWPNLFMSLMGTPDPNGRQLNGMGGGISSVSKVIVVEPSTRRDADVDYTFYQLGTKLPVVDTVGNCGNMASAVGPFALEQGLVDSVPQTSSDAARTLVRLFNTNTSKIIHSHFPISLSSPPYSPPSSAPITSSVSKYTPLLSGDFSIPGVSGTAARIQLDFVHPGGSKTGKLLPTGHATNLISSTTVPGYTGPTIQVSLMDCANPCVFLRAQDVELDGTTLPAALEENRPALDQLESIRRAGAFLMGMAPSFDSAPMYASAPKIGFVSPSTSHKLLSGEILHEDDTDFIVRFVSSGDPHRAIPITAAICTAGAANVPGSIVHEVRATSTRRGKEGEIVVGHPSGAIPLSAAISQGTDGLLGVEKGTVYRTARKLMEGVVFADGP